jgi:hypothetical protein
MDAHRRMSSLLRTAPTAVEQVSWDQILAWRMRRHHLTTRAAPEQLVDVVATLCGLHAQVPSYATLTLWARTHGLQAGALDQALWEDRSLVKLWAMRGTLHVLAARELGMWTAGLKAFRRYGELGTERFTELAEVIENALGGGPHTREELARNVERLSGSSETGDGIRGSWGLYLKPASLSGRLCFAPGNGRRVRFTTPHRWIPGGVATVDPEAGAAGIVLRYLRGYGPATLGDVARWWGAGLTPVRRALALLRDQVVQVVVEGTPRWLAVDDLAAVITAAPLKVARLLGPFDQWTAAAPRGAHVFAGPCDPAQVFRAQGWISAVVLVNGRIAGVWRHVRRGRRLHVEVEPLLPVPAWARAQLEDDATRLPRLLGGSLELRWAA